MVRFVVCKVRKGNYFGFIGNFGYDSLKMRLKVIIVAIKKRKNKIKFYEMW